MTEIIEVTNETKRQIKASACRSKLSGRLYVHIGIRHGEEITIPPNDHGLVEVKEARA